jgi:S1-C subfamily serine protease
MWTDARGTQRTGELLDSVTANHPKVGLTVASLYRIAETADNREYVTLELYVGGKTHEYRVSEEDGRKRMAQLRAS